MRHPSPRIPFDRELDRPFPLAKGRKIPFAVPSRFPYRYAVIKPDLGMPKRRLDVILLPATLRRYDLPADETRRATNSKAPFSRVFNEPPN